MHRAGAFTIAQDEASSVVYGMPKAAKTLGAVRQVLPLPGIADALVRLVSAQETL
jgi:two-component system chemotaxis response regulator CheB